MSRSAPPILDIAAFMAVAPNASSTRNAAPLGISKSNLGKAMQRLEARLETQRTTRALRFAEGAEFCLEAARAAPEGRGEAEVALAARRNDSVGRVRLDARVGFGGVLNPTFRPLTERYPQVTTIFP